MDVTSFLKMVPAAFGVAGLLTYLMRAREPASDHELVNLLQSARTTLVVLACAALIGLSVWLIFRPAPPDHDAAYETKIAAAVTDARNRLMIVHTGCRQDITLASNIDFTGKFAVYCPPASYCPPEGIFPTGT